MMDLLGHNSITSQGAFLSATGIWQYIQGIARYKEVTLFQEWKAV
jgi:hypothetical protein